MKKIILLLMLVMLFGCDENAKTSNIDFDLNEIKEINHHNEDLTYGITSYDAPALEDHRLSRMTLEQKVAQLFIIDFRAIDQDIHTNYDTKLLSFISQYPVGGFIYFNENIMTAEQVQMMNQQLQKQAKAEQVLAFFIAVDEEGGIVSRLGKKNIGVTHLPNATQLALENTPASLQEIGSSLGSQLRSLGFNVDFAPVFDTNINPDNPIIGTRAFSDDPKDVALYAGAFSDGLYAAGIIPFGKHFPGHGNTRGDSHKSAVTSTVTKEGFSEGEGYPFISAIENHIPGIMVGHILTPGLTSDGRPASLSKELLDGYVRQTLGYDGLLITDSLQMNAITQYYDDSEAAVLAFEAGCDLLLMPNDFAAAYRGILSAVRSGRISEDRLDQSIQRIFRYKSLNLY